MVSMKYLIDYLNDYSIENDQVQSLRKYVSRDGFVVLSNKEFVAIIDYFKKFPQDFEDMIPLMTDNNSNYICVYIRGRFKNAVCFLSHDEIDLYPKFKNISSLINAINENQNAWDFFGFSDKVFDFSEAGIV
jgi:hypothetical protein